MPQAAKSKVTESTENALNAAQVVFSLNPGYMPQARHLWQVQEQFLKDAEQFSSAWFKRRHDATRSALKLASQIAGDGVQDPASAMKAVTDWQTRSMERVAEDAKECAELMTRCAGNLIVNEIEAAEETAEEADRALATNHATPV